MSEKNNVEENFNPRKAWAVLENRLPAEFRNRYVGKSVSDRKARQDAILLAQTRLNNELIIRNRVDPQDDPAMYAAAEQGIQLWQDALRTAQTLNDFSGVVNAMSEEYGLEPKKSEDEGETWFLSGFRALAKQLEKFSSPQETPSPN